MTMLINKFHFARGRVAAKLVKKSSAPHKPPAQGAVGNAIAKRSTGLGDLLRRKVKAASR